MVLTLALEATGETRRLDQGKLVIGRKEGLGWTLPDDSPEPSLSRRHCQIEAAGGSFTLTDLGSTNGTRLNGRPVPAEVPTPLQAGDVVEIGAYRIAVALEAPASAAYEQARPAPRSIFEDAPARPGAPFGGGGGFTPAAPPPLRPTPATPPPAGSRSLDDLFGGWGTSDKAAAPRPTPAGSSPQAVSADPLAGMFSEDLAPLPLSRPSGEDATPGPSGPAVSEAFIQPVRRAARPIEPASSTAGPADDPFGLGAIDEPVAEPAPEPAPELAHPVATKPEPPPPPPPIEPVSTAATASEDDPFGIGARPARPVQTTPAPSFASDARQAPTPAPAPAPTAEVAPAELLAAFLEGAGLDPRTLDPGDARAFMREAGRSFARLAEGVRELLAVRATVKDHARLERTQIGAVQNNPLKFSVGAREATTALLKQREAGYMPPLVAIEASFRDLKSHELALLEGLQSAVVELLASFDPATLQGRLADAGALSLILQGGRRAKLWELYTERYEEIAKGARARFMGHFDGAFREAYGRKSAEVAAMSGPPSGPSQGS